MANLDQQNYERQILEIVTDLGRDLRVTIHPSRVIWTARYQSIPSFISPGIGSDQCDFDGTNVVLPRNLNGRISSEEWRPLLASQLIYQHGSKLEIVARWIGTVALFVIGWWIAAVFLAATFDSYGLALALSLSIPNIIIATWAFSHELRAVRLKADEKSAILVGPSVFLSVLEKVDSFHIRDIERRKNGGFHVRTSSHVPSIYARIRKIQSLIGQSP